MQSRNKAVILGFFAGAVVWSSTRSLLYGLEAAPLGGWAALLVDLDSPYEFVCKHTRRPAAAGAFPFGRRLADRLQSFGQGRFLHSLAGFAFFFILAKAMASYIGIYATLFPLVAVWMIFSLSRQSWRAIKEGNLQYDEFYGGFLLCLIVLIAASLFVLTTPLRWMLPQNWFIAGFMMGVGGNIVLELLSARGVPLLWPIRWHLRAPLIGETGGAREPWIVGLFLFGWVMWWANNYPGVHHFYTQVGVAKVLVVTAGIEYLKRLA